MPVNVASEQPAAWSFREARRFARRLSGSASYVEDWWSRITPS